MPYRGISVSDRPNGHPQQTTLWIGALSFEERCTASLDRLIDLGLPPSSALLFDYPTDVRPVAQDRERRRRNHDRIEAARRCAGDNLDLDFVELDPYSYRAAQRAVRRALESARPEKVVLDVSCLTKIHTVALADPKVFAADTFWELGYTVPETYGHLGTSASSGTGWRDVLVLPVGDARELRNETQARGIILAGHEGDRLVVALSEMEPVAGLIVTARSEGRPDLQRESARRNASVVRLLSGRGAGRWDQQLVSLREPARLAQAIQAQIAHALDGDAPVMLYPFGPKPFVALAAMQIAATDRLRGWFVYPIPSSYDVEYSYGIGATTWYFRNAPPVEGQQALGLPPRI